MATMGMYCKAYPIERFREFPGWKENAANAKTETVETGGRAIESPRYLAEEGCLFLQEDLVVTDGIFMDEHIIFDEVTPEWTAFCKNVLQFEPPVFEVPEIVEETSDAG